MTVFGDFDGEMLTGSQLRALLEPLGFKPEAIRVALHRLKADDWILAQKSGREAHYSLSARGRKETEAVRPEVYGQADSLGAWSIVLPENLITEKAAIPLGRDAFLVPDSAAHELENAVVLPMEGVTIPPWVEDVLVPPQLRSIANELTRILASADGDLDDMNSADLAALRLLALHHWRRLALRRGTVAHAALLKKGVICQCKDTVTALLERSARTLS